MIYLNNAATTYPKPQEVIDVVHSCLTNFPGYSLRNTVSNIKTDCISSSRKKIASFFNITNPNNLIFTSGSTESLNLAINGLNLKKSHVITTAREHNSVLRPLKLLEKKAIIDLTIVDCDTSGCITPSKIISAVQPHTKVAVLNQCSNVTGTYLDIKNISKVLHSLGIIVVVDASQSAGDCIIDVEQDNIDILAFTGHKSLYGIPGIGGIYIKEGLEILPLKTGGTGSYSELLYQPTNRPTYYEAGTQNIPGIVSLEAGISFLEKIGITTIASKKRQIVKYIWQALKMLPNIIIYGNDEYSSSIFSFNLKDVNPSEVGYILEQSFEIVVRSGLHCAPLIHKAMDSYPNGCVRVSPSFYTTQLEAEAFVQAIQSIYQAKRC